LGVYNFKKLPRRQIPASAGIELTHGTDNLSSVAVSPKHLFSKLVISFVRLYKIISQKACACLDFIFSSDIDTCQSCILRSSRRKRERLGCTFASVVLFKINIAFSQNIFDFAIFNLASIFEAEVVL